LLGSLAQVRRDPLAFLMRVSGEYGDIAHLRLGPFHVFLLNHPDDIEQVLVTQQHRFVKGRTLGGVRRLFGRGLLTSDGELHARQRRLMQPVFHRARLDAYARVMTLLASDRRNRWRDGDIVDIAGEMRRLTLAITCHILFGAEGDAIAAHIDAALHDATSVMEVAILPFAAVTDLLPVPQVRRLRRARATLDRVLTDAIERTRRNGAGGADVLSLLVSAQHDAGSEGMSDSQLRDEIITLILASHETTANALTWTWYLLARHESEDARLHAEVDAVLGSNGLPRIENLSDFPFVRMTLAESMRLYPPAWLLARVAVENHEARGYAVQNGSIVAMSPWVVHRNPRYFPDPDRFDPERWRVDGHHRPRFSYFPFGGGSRGCMGEAFAWMEGVLLLAVIGQRWRFRLLDDSAHPEVRPALTLTPKSGIPVRIERRS
jgi:cytochrome P450